MKTSPSRSAHGIAAQPASGYPAGTAMGCGLVRQRDLDPTVVVDTGQRQGDREVGVAAAQGGRRAGDRQLDDLGVRGDRRTVAHSGGHNERGGLTAPRTGRPTAGDQWFEQVARRAPERLARVSPAW